MTVDVFTSLVKNCRLSILIGWTIFFTGEESLSLGFD